VKLLSQVSGKSVNSKKVSLVGIVLGICMIAVVLVAYGQISMLQKNASDLTTNKNTLSSQVAALEAENAALLNQNTALEQGMANLTQQVTALQSQVAKLESDKTQLDSQMALLESEIAYYGHLAIPEYNPGGGRPVAV
jgi:cell division protein FtsB